jgi:hypothetical protein
LFHGAAQRWDEMQSALDTVSAIVERLPDKNDIRLRAALGAALAGHTAVVTAHLRQWANTLLSDGIGAGAGEPPQPDPLALQVTGRIFGSGAAEQLNPKIAALNTATDPSPIGQRR